MEICIGILKYLVAEFDVHPGVVCFLSSQSLLRVSLDLILHSTAFYLCIRIESTRTRLKYYYPQWNA